MSQQARRERQNNFALPSATEIQEMQTLEREREQRVSMRHQREMQRAQDELQKASIFSQIVIQVPSLIEVNKPLIETAREYMEIYAAKATAEIKKDPEAKEADPDPPADDDEEELSAAGSPAGDSN